MIRLVNNQENIFNVPLSGTSGITYDLSLTNKMTDFDIDGIKINDISTYPERYNAFKLNLSGITSVNLTGETPSIYVQNEGQYVGVITLNNVELFRDIFMVVGDAEEDTYTNTEGDNNYFYAYED